VAVGGCGVYWWLLVFVRGCMRLELVLGEVIMVRNNQFYVVVCGNICWSVIVGDCKW